MTTPDRFQSASGLRPASAFVLIGIVLCLVGAKAVKIALHDEGEEPANLTEACGPKINFDLCDARGRPLAVAVEYLELVMSPNAMWQAHTPDKTARELAQILGPEFTAERMLDLVLPDAKHGVIDVDGGLFAMNADQAGRVQSWIRNGTTEPDAESVPIAGMALHATRVAGEYGLSWSPAIVLSEKTRVDHKKPRALDWSRQVADDLYVCLEGRESFDRLDTDEALNTQRRKIWNALMPTHFRSVVKNVPPQTAMELFKLLKNEHVQGHQMDLVRNARRVYPMQPEHALEGADTAPAEILGRWGTLPILKARERARRELFLPADEHCSEQELDRLRIVTEAKVYVPTPMSGLELLAHETLEQPAWSFLERQREEYIFLANQAPRQPLQRYFQDLVPASPTPRVVTTLDVELMRRTRQWLERVMDEHHPAVAMAIAIEVKTGRVLAVDAIDPYEMGGFLPTMHTYTPGSTMKAVVMATAIDEGVVDLEHDTFNTFNGNFRIGSRTIHEAEGAQTGWLTPAQGLAYSCNAVLVQIGLRVPAADLRARFTELGYGEYPHSGLGGERKGSLTALPWKDEYTHASVCFGHEMLVTLWQHAAALATVIRGGEYRPLTLIDAVEQDGVRHAIPLAPPRPVFKPETCAKVREMMMLGAREGTGKKVYCPDIVMGTKTGTAQKVPTEPCLHVELEHNREHHCNGACRARLVGLPKPHRGSCYTSSMCAFGRMPDDEREVMVYVVVDEPRGGKKYGADVAGPAAVGILEEALGYLRGGTKYAAPTPEGFVPMELASTRPANASPSRKSDNGTRRSFELASTRSSEEPWAEDAHAPR
jgi:cell division protein FtsI/penicillin-binding protein 2